MSPCAAEDETEKKVLGICILAAPTHGPRILDCSAVYTIYTLIPDLTLDFCGRRPLDVS